MLLAKKIHILFGCAALLFVALLLTPMFPGRAFADHSVTCSDNSTIVQVSDGDTPDAIDQKCKDAIAEQDGSGGSQINPTANPYNINPADNCDKDAHCCDNNANCITRDIQIFMNVLIAGVGIVVTIVIVLAGIQYTTSRDNPQIVQAAKMRILNAVIALVAFLFLYAFLQWLVPGGVF